MSNAGYVFLRPHGSAATWNGKRFNQLTKPIGVQRGYSVAEFLREQGVAVDDGNLQVEALLRKLVLGRVSGIAVSQPRWRDLKLRPQGAIIWSWEGQL